MNRAASYVLLFVALVCVSTSGPFLRLSGMDALALVVWRMLLAGALFLGWAALRGELRIERRHLPRIALGAVFLAAHFCLWIKAFDLTDYASNLLLLVFQPVIAAFLGMRLGERPTRRTWISIGLATAGLLIIAGGDVALGPRALLGDAFCILGDLGIALFYVVARDARARTPLPTFMGTVMLMGAACALPVALLTGTRLIGYPTAAWPWLAALVVVTTVGGHGLMNLCARHVRLYTVNVVIVLEPFLGIVIGALFFPVAVRSLQIAGGVVLAVAVWIGIAER